MPERCHPNLNLLSTICAALIASPLATLSRSYNRDANVCASADAMSPVATIHDYEHDNDDVGFALDILGKSSDHRLWPRLLPTLNVSSAPWVSPMTQITPFSSLHLIILPSYPPLLHLPSSAAEPTLIFWSFPSIFLSCRLSCNTFRVLLIVAAELKVGRHRHIKSSRKFQLRTIGTRVINWQNCRGRSRCIVELFMIAIVCEENLMPVCLFESEQNKSS